MFWLNRRVVLIQGNCAQWSLIANGKSILHLVSESEIAMSTNNIAFVFCSTIYRCRDRWHMFAICEYVSKDASIIRNTSFCNIRLYRNRNMNITDVQTFRKKNILSEWHCCTLFSLLCCTALLRPRHLFLSTPLGWDAILLYIRASKIQRVYC